MIVSNTLLSLKRSERLAQSGLKMNLKFIVTFQIQLLRNRYFNPCRYWSIAEAATNIWKAFFLGVVMWALSLWYSSQCLVCFQCRYDKLNSTSCFLSSYTTCSGQSGGRLALCLESQLALVSVEGDKIDLMCAQGRHVPHASTHTSTLELFQVQMNGTIKVYCL